MNYFDKLIGAKVFFKIDLRSKCHQVRIKEDEINNITFKTKYGDYDFVVVPFGLSNALFIFMCLLK